ncbi:regulator of DNA class I crossover intermediates 1 isoform X2 [Lissotriton helveticus]
MNWIGGSRSRIMLKQEKRKQKEFFEKRKLISKMKLLEVSLSPSRNSAISLDLLNLYVVNQIASKKDKSDISRKAVHVDMKTGIKMPFQRQRNIELSLSPPRVPSKICIDDNPNIQQQHVKENYITKKVLSDKMKHHPLSPVLESSSSSSQMECQYNTSEDCNIYPSSSSVSWSPIYKFSSEESDTTQGSSPWDQACEEKRDTQFLPFSKPEKRVFGDRSVGRRENVNSVDRQADVVQFGKLDQQSNCCSGSINFVDKTCIMNIGKELETSYREEDLFYGFQSERIPPIFDLLEGPNQQVHTPLEDCEVFNNEDPIPQVFTANANRIRQQDLQHLRSKPRHTQSTVDRCLESIVTLPEQHCLPNINMLKNNVTSEQFENSMTGNYEMSRNLIRIETSDAESLLCSRSPSYSPRDTDSCFSASSEMNSDDDVPNTTPMGDAQYDAIDSHKKAFRSDDAAQPSFLKGTGPLNSLYRMSISEKEAFSPLTKAPHYETSEEKKDTKAMSQHDSVHTSCIRNADYKEDTKKCDAWSQTEVQKRDASTQCKLMEWKCGGYCSGFQDNKNLIKHPYNITKIDQ